MLKRFYVIKKKYNKLTFISNSADIKDLIIDIGKEKILIIRWSLVQYNQQQLKLKKSTNHKTI